MTHDLSPIVQSVWYFELPGNNCTSAVCILASINEIQSFDLKRWIYATPDSSKSSICALNLSQKYIIWTQCVNTLFTVKKYEPFRQEINLLRLTLKHPHGRESRLKILWLCGQQYYFRGYHSKTWTFIRDFQSFISHIQWESEFHRCLQYVVHERYMDFRCVIDKIKSMKTKVRWQGCVLIHCCQQKNRQKYIIYK